MSRVVDFFKGGTMPLVDRFLIHRCASSDGITLDEIISLDDNDLERSHNIIQWIFPLHEKSYHSKYHPILLPDDIEELRESNTALNNICLALIRFEKFFGIAEDYNEKKQKQWCHDGNHNLLRITRIIRSLRLFGLEHTAKNFYENIVEVAKRNNIPHVTFEFWEKALKDPVMASMTDKFLEMKRIDL